MALLTKKKNTKEKKEEKKVFTITPRITEKSNNASASSVYVFNIPEGMNKLAIAGEVFKLYKVKPVKVNIVSIPSEKVFVRGKWGVKKGGKKAYVFLEKGKSIEFA